MSDTLWPHEPQHARRPCSSPTPRVDPNPCPLSRWRHPAISSSVVPFSSCPQSFPASRSFSMSQLFQSGGQSIGVSASASVLPMNIQDWFPLGWAGWISLQSKGSQRVRHDLATKKQQQQCYTCVSVQFSSLQLLSRVQLFATPWTATCQTSLSYIISWTLLKLMSIESVMPPNIHIFCHPLLLLPSIFLSIRVFSNELALHVR